MKSLLKNLAFGLVLIAGVSFASCSSDNDTYTPSDDAEAVHPLPEKPEHPMAPTPDFPIAPEAGN
nr:hypothetical protein [uncultured Carboxylicivirga sp.]